MWNPNAENCYQEWIVQYWVHGACSVCEDDPADNKGTCGLPTHRTAFNIEAETIWTPFRRRLFHVHFLQWKLWYFDWIFTEICSQGPIDNNPALVQIMAWRRSVDKPLSEPMMVTLPTHICVARPQWVNGCNAVCTLCNMVWVNWNIQELKKFHYGVYWCTGAFLVLSHLQPS